MADSQWTEVSKRGRSRHCRYGVRLICSDFLITKQDVILSIDLSIELAGPSALRDRYIALEPAISLYVALGRPTGRQDVAGSILLSPTPATSWSPFTAYLYRRHWPGGGRRFVWS